QCSLAHRDLHSFPTRRSSDLSERLGRRASYRKRALQASMSLHDRIAEGVKIVGPTVTKSQLRGGICECHVGLSRFARLRATAQRSEEHTSELQSRSDLVCRLL